MGAAIPVMHYTGMAAASFTPSGMSALGRNDTSATPMSDLFRGGIP
jgi:NO-binding membrane sensor protein with MHYT domain